jgi:hypothetical protein
VSVQFFTTAAEKFAGVTENIYGADRQFLCGTGFFIFLFS